MRNSILLAVGALVFASSVTLSSAFADAPTKIFDACGKDERIRFADNFPEMELGLAKGVSSDKSPGSEIYRAGFKLSQSKTSWEVREIGAYLKARAYYGDGLVHLAYQRFMAQLILPLQPGVPVVGREGALQCVLKIQSDYPTLGFGRAVVPNLLAWMKRPDVDEAGRENIGRALVVRMKEVVNEWDEKEASAIIASLGNLKGWALYAQALAFQRNGQFMKAIPLWERLTEKSEMPSVFAQDRDTALVLYARDLYESKKYDKAADILRMIPRDSNYLAQALSDLSWSLLQAGKRPEAIGAAFNIQKSLLTRVYAPEAPLVASIALHEMCQYARALKNAVFFKKKYYPVLIWYNKLTPSQKEHQYALLTTALRKKGGVPNLVLLEWLRSPEYRAYQLESNLYFDEKKAAYTLHTSRVNAEKGAQWLKEWKAPLPRFYSEVSLHQKDLGKSLNGVLSRLTARMAKQVAKMAENVQLLEVEIFDHAGEDMVWRNVNTDYQKWLEEQESTSRAKERYWEWGSIPVDPKVHNEVWEDELGWTSADVTDECKTKDHFREDKFGAKAPKPAASAAPATEAPTPKAAE